VVSLDDVGSALWALEKEEPQPDDEVRDGDPLDVGEAVAQALALSIDPFATHPEHVRSERGICLDPEAMQSFFSGTAGGVEEGGSGQGECDGGGGGGDGGGGG
ncbi:unnamed protein product, partial [Discosporangium mesarthrocarpum]